MNQQTHSVAGGGAEVAEVAEVAGVAVRLPAVPTHRLRIQTPLLHEMMLTPEMMVTI